MGSLLLLLASCSALLACAKSESARAVGGDPAIGVGENKLRAGGTIITVELASTESERASGLMYRDSLPKDHGMLFIYPQPQPLSFWMRNTIIPLSIAFFNDDGVIVNILEMKPGIEVPPYRSEKPCRFALEMATHWFSDHGVKAGDRIEIPEHILRMESEP
jgi:uncharacterized membrane protein (UPF0127 family)